MFVYGPMAEDEGERAAGMAEMFTGGVKTVSKHGVKDGPIGSQATGYNIVEAESLAAAAEMAKGCPLLPAGRQIVVYEAFSSM